MKYYHKLVRDKIPEIIEASGETCKTRILKENEFEAALTNKLHEEFLEFVASDSKEEMADILEVIDTIIQFNDWSIEDIRKIQEEKRKARGGFEQRIFLISTEERD